MITQSVVSHSNNQCKRVPQYSCSYLQDVREMKDILSIDLLRRFI